MPSKKKKAVDEVATSETTESNIVVESNATPTAPKKRRTTKKVTTNIDTVTEESSFVQVEPKRKPAVSKTTTTSLAADTSTSCHFGFTSPTTSKKENGKPQVFVDTRFMSSPHQIDESLCVKEVSHNEDSKFDASSAFVSSSNHSSVTTSTSYSASNKSSLSSISSFQTIEQSMIGEVNDALSNMSLQRNISIPDNTISIGKEKVNPTEFYLYHDLESDAQKIFVSSPKYKLPSSDQEFLMKNIKHLDVDGMRMLFVIIRMFAVKNKHSPMFDLPFKGKVLKENNSLFDIEFDLLELPTLLQVMMVKFTKKHLECIEVNKLRISPSEF